MARISPSLKPWVFCCFSFFVPEYALIVNPMKTSAMPMVNGRIICWLGRGTSSNGSMLPMAAVNPIIRLYVRATPIRVTESPKSTLPMPQSIPNMKVLMVAWGGDVESMVVASGTKIKLMIVGEIMRAIIEKSAQKFSHFHGLMNFRNIA